MLLIRGVVGFLLVALWIYCIVDVVTRDKSQVRSLPKLVWLPIVVLLGPIGAVLWLMAGRARETAQPDGVPDEGPPRIGPNPDDDEDFLRGVGERMQEERRQAAQQRRAEERDRQAQEARDAEERDRLAREQRRAAQERNRAADKEREAAEQPDRAAERREADPEG